MIFGINTTRDIWKLPQISKYHSWYLCQVSLQIMLLPIQIIEFNFFFKNSFQTVLLIIRCRYVACVEDEFVGMKECDESKVEGNNAVKTNSFPRR